jgi:Zn-dependent protease/CBS domain-containing protein
VEIRGAVAPRKKEEESMGESLRIGRILGISIEIHVSWLIVFALVTWTLWATYFDMRYMRQGDLVPWTLAIVTSLLFFASVLLHELAHSVVALLFKIPVKRITLFIFGGVAQIGREVPSAGAELAVAIAGPFTSIMLAIGFGVLWGLGTLLRLAPLRDVSGWLALQNGVLVAFNLIPGFPLDGGRVFRSILWMATDDFRVATRIASKGGELVGFLFMMGGGLIAFIVRNGLLNGLWFFLIGWLLVGAARQSYGQVMMGDLLKDVTVGHIMRRDVQAVPPGMTISEVVTTFWLRGADHVLPVIDGRSLLGLIFYGDVRRIPRHAWSMVAAISAMRRAETFPRIIPQDDLGQAFEKMTELDVQALPVMDDGEFVGLLFHSDIMRLLQTRGEIG